MINTKSPKPIVLGLGNPLFQDEGLGIHVIHRLMEGELDGRTELIDGGTDGLILLGTVEEARHLIVIDAIDGGFPPGTINEWEGCQIPLFAHGRLSPHQLGFQEVLALARMRGKFPEHMILFGVQSKSLDWGTDLTPEVAGSVPTVINLVHKQIENWLA